MPGKTSENTPRKINVVDRRHHAHGEATEGSLERRSQYPTMVEELRARTESAEKGAREAVARAEAELEAVRERLQRDVERRVNEGRSDLLSALLDVADNLDRAAETAAGESESICKGIELVRQQLQGILEKEGVEPIRVLGESYDPHVAEAVSVETVEPERDNRVIEEIQRGYRFGQAILRAARVRVGKTSTR